MQPLHLNPGIWSYIVGHHTKKVKTVLRKVFRLTIIVIYLFIFL